MQTTRNHRFLYRVTLRNAAGEQGTFLAEVNADLDETARRRVVAHEMNLGSIVKQIRRTNDKTVRRGDWFKRRY